MDDSTRGRIRNPDRAAQLRDFSGLRYGNCTPTDVDMLIEFSNRLFVMVELKMTGAPMDYGQQLCFQRVTDALSQSRKKAVAVVAEHNTPIGTVINCKTCVVRQYYENGRWIERPEGKTNINLGDFIDFYYETYVGDLPKTRLA